MGTEEKKYRPFHESVIEIIQIASYEELTCIGMILRSTKIPKNHDAIIEAWQKRRNKVRTTPLSDVGLGVVENLLEQKRIAESEATSESTKEGIDLDELQKEVEKLLALLNDRQTGTMGWHGFMKERLEDLHTLTSKALGK